MAKVKTTKRLQRVVKKIVFTTPGINIDCLYGTLYAMVGQCTNVGKIAENEFKVGNGKTCFCLKTMNFVQK